MPIKTTSGLAYLLFFIYLALLLFIIPRMGFFKKSSLTPLQLRAFFTLKVAAGVAYGYFHAQRGGGDTWEYFHDSFKQLEQLRTSPMAFFATIFSPGYQTGYGDFFGIQNSWWNDLDWIMITKSLALLNLLSGTNYYINTIFFNLFSFTGCVLLFKVWKKVLPGGKPLFLFAPFLIPSFLFWTSGIHKENLLLLGLGLVIYPVFFGLAHNRWTLKRVAIICIGALLILALRNFLLLPLAASLFCWLLADKLKHLVHPLATFLLTFFFFSLVFFSARFIAPSLDFPRVVIDRQEAFNQLGSTNRFAPLPLQPTVTSFVSNAPIAFFRAAFKPLPQDATDLQSGISAAESTLLLTFLLLSLLLIPKSRWRHPFLLFCLFFSFSIMLTIGFTVVFPGAIVRYRSIALPLFVMPALAVMHRSLINKKRNRIPF